MINRKHVLIWTAVGAVFAALAVGYYLVDPVGEYGAYMPKCTLRALTGWECPGCGAQRAVHALLHGRWAEAWWTNPFLWCALAYVGAIFVSRAVKWRKVYEALVSATACYTYIALYIAWWVARNVMRP